LSIPDTRFEILSEPEEVAPYVDQVRTAADQEKDSLGFLPERVYKDAAIQGKLLIATINQGDTVVYAGHLLHGGVFPQAKIFQVYTVPAFRRKGVGLRMVESLVKRAETLQFLSVVAKVADDLVANRFWERLSFETVRTETGGRTTGRTINIRVRELDTPRLFSLGTALAVSSPSDLKLISRLFDTSPLYVLDLNILFDLLKKRANAEDVGRIVRASFNNLVRLAVTEEFIKELERTSDPAPRDPVLELALKLPRLQAPPPERLSQIVKELGRVLFHAEISAGRLRRQDSSDLIHLATAIHHEASGFVTGEKAILRGREVLQLNYSLDVVGANDFADTVEPSDPRQAAEVRASSGQQNLQGRPALETDRSAIEKFLDQMMCPRQIKQDAIRNDPGRPHRRMVVTINDEIVGFGSWEIPSSVRPFLQAFVCIDEDRAPVTLTTDFLLDSLCRESLSDYPVQISLRLLPGHVTTRRIAIAHGFRPSANEPPNSSVLQKIALRQIVTARTWAAVIQQLKRGMGVELPDAIPTYHSPGQNIQIKGPSGQTIAVALEELETLLSPCLFCLPGRGAAIVPIRRVYSADLIGGANQLSWLASAEAKLLRQRVYFSHPRTAKVIEKGVPIFFYESARNGGRASVTAAARIVRTEFVPKDGTNQELLRSGVLDEKALKKICLADTVLATTIDNIIIFENPVGLKRLRRLGAIDGANLVTARKLRPDQVDQLINEGMD
jgi:GNAT superfamily N-acetyltransferase/predicted nucleic acid-binding protein